MGSHKSPYELSESQVTTPHSVVSLFWDLVHRRRDSLGSVLDMGAGDCRFSKGGRFNHYVGVEIDKERSRIAAAPENGKIINGCVFRHRNMGYDACIGNPPYVRHHDIESPWKEKTSERLENQLGISLNKRSNLYLYFLSLGLLKTHSDGLLALVIPYEWVARPSALGVRDYILKQGWEVAVYRFRMPIFDGVLTTASISIVDKRQHSGRWSFFDISPDYKIFPRSGVVDGSSGVLDYVKRGKIWAMRGLSTGSQKIFTLTEKERIKHGLSRRDVVPCVTTLRYVPQTLRELNPHSFQKHFVESGRRCWLIKSYKKVRSAALNAYLLATPKSQRDTYTCRHQKPWFRFSLHPIPSLLVSSGFMKLGPKVLVNKVDARAVGVMYGVHSKQKPQLRLLQRHLLRTDFESHVVAHARTLKKVEVKQLNCVLNTFPAMKNSHDTPRD